MTKIADLKLVHNNAPENDDRNSNELASLRTPKKMGVISTAALILASVSSAAAQEKGNDRPLQQEFVPKRHANIDVANIPGYEMLRTGGVLDLLRGGSRVQENPELTNTGVPKRPLIISFHNAARAVKNYPLVKEESKNKDNNENVQEAGQGRRIRRVFGK